MFNRLDHLNAVDRRKVHPLVAPRDAVSLLLVERTVRPYRLLMGRRPAGQAFMPDVYVFPGGAVEPVDHAYADKLMTGAEPGEMHRNFLTALATDPPADDGPPTETDRTLEQTAQQETELQSAVRQGAALLHCGLRELGEETGLKLNPDEFLQDTPLSPQTDTGPDVAIGRGSMTGPEVAIGRGDLPFYLSRAVTPPGRKKRFDTRFFVYEIFGAEDLSINDSAELLDLRWVSYKEALELPLHAMTRVILEDAHDVLGDLPAATRSTRLIQPGRVAYYTWNGNGFSHYWLEVASSA